MTPILLTGPTAHVVDLNDLKTHLRVDHSEEDMLIEALERAAVGYLDGWRGVLGRSIMPQTWRVTVGCAGCYALPMPDVTAATMGGADLALSVVGAACTVTTEAAGDIEFTCAMPVEQLASVQVAVKLLVGHWYQNREAASDKALVGAPMAVDMLINALRWRLM